MKQIFRIEYMQYNTMYFLIPDYLFKDIMVVLRISYVSCYSNLTLHIQKRFLDNKLSFYFSFVNIAPIFKRHTIIYLLHYIYI